MDISDVLIGEIKQLRKQKAEKNIFSIGGRGHYENPISDVLAFFLNPKEEHGFGTLFLESLFKAANVTTPRMILALAPDRECQTSDGYRMDVLLRGEDWVLLVENKIRHVAANPFDAYRKHLATSFPGVQAHHILLSTRQERQHEGWINVTWSQYVEQVQQRIGRHLLSPRNAKWDVIAREFLLNVQNQYGNSIMDEKRREFTRKNFAAFQQVMEMIEEYVAYLAERGKEVVNAESGKDESFATSRRNNWLTEGTALRFESPFWGGKTNITLLLRLDGSFTLQLYVYDVPDEAVPTLRLCIDQAKYSNYWIEQRTTRCYGYFNSLSEHLIFDEVGKLVNRLDEYYSLVAGTVLGRVIT